MLYEKFIRLVEDHAELLTQNWIKEVITNPSTAGYKNMSSELLGNRIFDVYNRLGNWLLSEDQSYYNIADHFMNLGKERAREGLKLSEVIYALILARVVLWKYVIDHGIISSSIELQQAFEFHQKVTNFFDKASYFVAVGYEKLNVKNEEKDNEDLVNKAIDAVTKWFIKDLK
jgi:hypothetical protein